MNIDIQSLIAAGVGPTQAKLFANPLRDACEAYAIKSKERVAAFLAQAMHESANFTRMEENLLYSTPERIRQVFSSKVKTLEEAKALVRNPQALANRVYANRLGNGDEASGQGWKYRGRGIFQLTGFKNYDLAGIELGQPFVMRPDLVALPEFAAQTAAHFWYQSGCNELADAGNVNGITRKINGTAMAGAKERVALNAQTLEAFA